MEKRSGLTILCGIVFLFLTTLPVGGNRIPTRDSRSDIDTARHLAPFETSSVMDVLPRGSCSISRDNCGDLYPQNESVFIADGAFNLADSTLFFIDVPSGSDGVFQVDPATCSVVSGTYYSINGGISQRGIGYNREYDQIWVGGWNDSYLNRHEADPPYQVLSQTYTSLGIASIAVDDANDLLFVGTNSYPDMVYVYDISGGPLGELLGSWVVPWQSGSNGYDMAGMAFDDDRGQLVMVNQYRGGGSLNTRETFDFDLAVGLTPVEDCDLGETAYAWGIALIESTYSDSALSTASYHPDITGFAPPFDVDEYRIPPFEPPYELSCTMDIWWGKFYLNWSNGDTYDVIHVYRDGCLVAELPGEETHYTDFYTRIPRNYQVRGVVAALESGSAECGLYYFEWDDGFYFDDSDDGFTAGGSAGWEWGEPSHMIWGNGWETVLGGDYPDNACGWLESPDIYSDWGVDLHFYTYDDVECVHDGWNVQASTDGGSSWEIIYPYYSGYDQGEPTGSCDEGLGGETNCGSGVIRTWSFPLSDWDNTMFRFRILFESNDEISSTGVVLDNVTIGSGIRLPVTVRAQLLNPDSNGDGVGDVHLGEYLTYRISYINQTEETMDYAIDHLFYAATSCGERTCSYYRYGPQCAGTLAPEAVDTRFFRVKIPCNTSLLDMNPWSVEDLTWECDAGEPKTWGGRSCFPVTLLPARHPPPEPVSGTEFVIEEIQDPSVF